MTYTALNKNQQNRLNQLNSKINAKKQLTQDEYSEWVELSDQQYLAQQNVFDINNGLQTAIYSL